MTSNGARASVPFETGGQLPAPIPGKMRPAAELGAALASEASLQVIAFGAVSCVTVGLVVL